MTTHYEIQYQTGYNIDSEHWFSWSDESFLFDKSIEVLNELRKNNGNTNFRIIKITIETQVLEY
jgi:hypothetical protein